ncbi:methyltransferase domain-containing protein [Parafrankia elaeagni]|uniref:methyltransferase domain-containing protein n=1 Tax=Parafrankia elaeagni TaxID=222534 RepID=UPI0004762D9D|nr:methyltransferase domain-containing protein [Parafrankia elaeagni]
MASTRPSKAARSSRSARPSSRSAGGHADADLLIVRRHQDHPDTRRRLSSVETTVLAGARVCPGQDLVDLSQASALTPAALGAVVPGGSVTTLTPTAPALHRIRPTPENGHTWGSVWDLTERPLPLPDASVDAVIGRSVLAPLSHPRRMLIDIARVLKPGGRLSVHEILLGQRRPVALDGLSAHEMAQAERVLTAVRPAAHAFTVPHAVGNARLAGLTHIEYTEETVTVPLIGVTAADDALHARGPAGESAYQAIGRVLGASFGRQYAEAWRSTARRRPIILETPTAYLTMVKPDTTG